MSLPHPRSSPYGTFKKKFGQRQSFSGVGVCRKWCVGETSCQTGMKNEVSETKCVMEIYHSRL